MKNRFFILSVLLLVVGIVLYRYWMAAFDTETILQEQYDQIKADFQHRSDEARQAIKGNQAEVLFSKRFYRNEARPDFAFYQYDSTGYTAWSYEGFGIDAYPSMEEEAVAGMGVAGVLRRASKNIWSYIPAYIPQKSSFKEWSFSETAGSFPIKTQKGTLVGYLKKGSIVKDSLRSWKVLVALGVFFLIFSFWLLTLVYWIRKERGDKAGAGVLIGGLFSFALAYYYFELNWALRGISLFWGETNISVGSCLIYAGLTLWASIVFFRRFSYKERVGSTIKSTVALTNYGLSLMGLLVLVVLLDYPFTKWSGFVAQHVLAFDLKGFGMLLFACVLVLSYFFYSHRLVLNVYELGLSRNKRLIILIISALVFGLVLYVFEGQPVAFELALTGFIYLLLFDFYLDSHTSSLTWLISWIFVLSILLTLLFSYYYKGASFEKLALFSLFFSIITSLVLILAIVNTIINAVPFSEMFPMFWGGSLRNKVQLYVVILTLGSFGAIGLVTANSFNNYNQQKQIEAHFSSVEIIVKTIGRQMADGQNLDQVVSNISTLFDQDINLYGTDGRIRNVHGQFFTPYMEPSAYNQFKQPNVKSINTIVSRPNEIRKTTYVPIRRNDGIRLAYVGIPYKNEAVSTRLDLLAFLGDLLTVYIFLMLIISSLSIVIANLITKPISRMGQKLKDVTLDGNEALEWEGNDEIGQLVNNYNAMIVKLEKSTTLLRQSEREGAWREMAKQVAHEIKNPLTPMKLSIQHLMRVYESDPEQAAPLVKRMSKTLIDQIDGLVTISDEFSNFAKMPKASPEHLSLSALVQSVVDLFAAKQESDQLQIMAQMPAEEIFIEADKNHLTRIFNNLIKNAIQSIPEDRKGEITVRLFKEKEGVFIQIEDNGEGIPESVQPKVFQPNFTTKNSGTGIGLAMTKNMVENAGGKISFQTEIGVGTIFKIVFPLW